MGGAGYSGSSESTATSGGSRNGGYSVSNIKGIDPKIVVIGACVMMFLFVLPKLRK